MDISWSSWHVTTVTTSRNRVQKGSCEMERFITAKLKKIVYFQSKKCENVSIEDVLWKPRSERKLC